MVGCKGRQPREFVEDHVRQILVERTDFHVSWLAAPVTQIPLGATEDVVWHECCHQPIEGVSKDGFIVEACVRRKYSTYVHTP